MRLPLVIVAVLSLLALGFLELRGRPRIEPPPPPVVDVGELAGPRRPSEREAIPLPTETIALSAPPPIEGRPAEAAFARAESSSTRVRAIDAESKAPVAGTTVRAFASFEDPSAEPERLEATTGADGVCTLELPRDASFLHLALRSPESDVQLASWSGAPALEIVVELPPEVFVHGLVLPPSAGDLGFERLGAWAQAPNGRAPLARYVGRGAVVRDGSFRFPFRAAPGEDELEVRVVEAGRAMPLASLRAPIDLWTRPPGPTIRVEVAEFELYVDSGSGPIEGADVILKVDFGPDARGIERLPYEAVVATDESGRVRFLAPCGEARLTISHPRHRSSIERILLPSTPVQRTLRRLHRSEWFTARAVAADGEPVAGATVTVASTESGPNAPPIARARTGANGNAVLPLAIAGPAVLHGDHPDHGLVGPIPVELARNAFIVFRFQEPLSLVLAPRVPADAFGGACGRLDACVIDLESSRTYAATWFEPPYELRDLPRGDYVVFALYAGSRLHAYEHASAGPARRQVLPLRFRAGRELLGSIVSPDPGAIEAALDLPDLPAEIEARFCASSLRPGGSFALFAGSASTAQLTFRAGGQVLWSATVDASKEVELVLRAP